MAEIQREVMKYRRPSIAFRRRLIAAAIAFSSRSRLTNFMPAHSRHRLQPPRLSSRAHRRCFAAAAMLNLAPMLSPKHSAYAKSHCLISPAAHGQAPAIIFCCRGFSDHLSISLMVRKHFICRLASGHYHARPRAADFPPLAANSDNYQHGCRFSRVARRADQANAALETTTREVA